MFPWVALELGPASLGNPPGFDGEPFVAFQHAAVRAKLLPLIHQRLEIARVEVDGLDVRLRKNAEGKGNWEDFGKTAAAPAGAASISGAAASSASGGALLEGFGGLKVTHARVSYQQYVLENITAETTPFMDGVVPISIHLDANRGVATEHANVEVKVDFSNPTDKHYHLAALTVVGQASMAGDNRPLRFNLSTAGVDIDLTAQTLSVPSFAANVTGAQVNGSLQGTKILDDLRLAGSVTLAPVVLRELMPRWAMASPQTRDPRAFSQVSGSTAFTYGGNALRFDAIRAVLDDTHLTGTFAVENLDTQAIKFALAVDKIDVDRYLPPEEAATPGKAAAASAEAAAKAAKGAAASPEPARPLLADGTLTVGAVQIARIALTNVRLTLAAKDGVMRIFPLQAQVEGGAYSGDVAIDSRGAVPLISLDEHLSGVDMATLLAGSGKSVHLSGKGTLNLKATGRGTTTDSLLRTLNGHLDAYMTNGAVEGIDIGYELSRAEALLRRESGPAVPNTHRTQFDALKTSADIANGMAQTKDLLASSQVLKVTGQGSTNLLSKAIDFHLLADTLRTTQGVPIQVPIIVGGTTSDPTVRPDVEALAKGQLRQKLQDVLQDKLKGLFGKP